ncbi:hypothetical protein AALP_AA7G278700 [Arabis alpina]|uniref:Knottin scorpion toxin-like domain-containing protein n=1 Tax=Arabis alpina TaxID=50452 RepID=A0A087GL16_ARAAL|nr:hypothetical protein AALP_AA7G278700 [Arabis alpina]
MDKIRSSIVVSAITIILLFVIADQASVNAISAELFCYGPCKDDCQQICNGEGMTQWFCQNFRGTRNCCCVPDTAKNQMIGQRLH